MNSVDLALIALVVLILLVMLFGNRLGFRRLGFGNWLTVVGAGVIVF